MRRDTKLVKIWRQAKFNLPCKSGAFFFDRFRFFHNNFIIPQAAPAPYLSIVLILQLLSGSCFFAQKSCRLYVKTDVIFPFFGA